MTPVITSTLAEIDDDSNRYTVGKLREWRRISEEAALVAIETGEIEAHLHINDANRIRSAD